MAKTNRFEMRLNDESAAVLDKIAAHHGLTRVGVLEKLMLEENQWLENPVLPTPTPMRPASTGGFKSFGSIAGAMRIPVNSDPLGVTATEGDIDMYFPTRAERAAADEQRRQELKGQLEEITGRAAEKCLDRIEGKS